MSLPPSVPGAVYQFLPRLLPGVSLSALPTQPHLNLPAADPVAATGKLLADFHQGGDTESCTHKPELILLPTIAEAELGQRVSHGVCK